MKKLGNTLSSPFDYRYRLLAVLAVALSLGLTTAVPHDQRRLHMPDPWSYEIARDHFAQGMWVLTDAEMGAARAQTRLRGGPAPQYIRIDEDRWAFRQAAGHPLQMLLFQRLGHPRLANITLALLAALALYLLLARWHNERLALVGVVLFFWSPLTLTALHYYNMDTFAGGSLPLIAGALLLWAGSKSEPGKYTSLLYFAIGLILGWSVVVRLTNLLLLPLFAAYLMGAERPQSNPVRSPKRRPRRSQPHPQSVWRPVITPTTRIRLGLLGGGCLLALTILAVYNQTVFGHWFDTGYAYQSADDPLYLWKENPVTSVPGGVATWLAGGTILHMGLTVLEHIGLWLRPATFAWPLWPLGLIGMVQLLRQRPKQATTWFIILWIAAVYAPYAGIVFFGVTRALAVPFNQTWGFFVPARYLFPISFPLILLVIYLLNGRRQSIGYTLAAVYALTGAWIFVTMLAN